MLTSIQAAFNIVRRASDRAGQTNDLKGRNMATGMRAARELTVEELLLVSGGSQTDFQAASSGVWEGESDQGMVEHYFDETRWDGLENVQFDISAAGMFALAAKGSFTSGVTSELDEVLSNIPDVQQSLKNYLDSGLSIQFREMGAANGYVELGSIYLNPNIKGDALQMARTIAHELAHVENRVTWDHTPTREEYIATYLKEEGRGVLAAMKANDVLAAKYPEAATYTWDSRFIEIKNKIGSEYTVDQAIKAMGDIYGGMRHPTDPNKTQADYLAEPWDETFGAKGGSGAGGWGGTGGTGGAPWTGGSWTWGSGGWTIGIGGSGGSNGGRESWEEE
ncbi:hypothetical protein [Stenotrophomonas sp. MYb57]|uniref:hypothetical protein n=1 Tax=Stenotrophomonas sp. MYb57 TaxID=1827305 RepID=UPI00131A24B8|nr:hypothetical protein [Stenotrophomonas sp. MYb57]